MILWLDEQLSPYLARWIELQFGVTCQSVIHLPVNRADDLEIFHAARNAGAVIVSKDGDFVDWVGHLGSPPSVVWVTCGNCSNAAMREILSRGLPVALAMIESGESIVEIF